MNKKFLNRVIKQVTSETRMDFTRVRVYTPFSSVPLRPPFLLSLLPPSSPFPLFSEHCENVYALNNGEMDYVWKEYKDIIKDKIENE